MEDIMPDLDDIFPSKYLKVADLKGQTRIVAIAGIEVSVIGQGASAAQKPVMRLATPEGAAIPKMFVANKTNCNQLAHDYGTRRIDGWIGRRMELIPSTTQFQGQVVPCIRVRGVGGQAASGAAAAAPATPFPAEAGELDDIKW
jgi:hypothetical protein